MRSRFDTILPRVFRNDRSVRWRVRYARDVHCRRSSWCSGDHHRVAAWKVDESVQRVAGGTTIRVTTHRRVGGDECQDHRYDDGQNGRDARRIDARDEDIDDEHDIV